MKGKAPQGYLEHLDGRLKCGVRRLPATFRRRQAQFVLRCQSADGGFPGRQGASDVYYTSFALRAADLLGVPDAATLWSDAAGFVGEHGVARNVIECFCLLSAHRALQPRCNAVLDTENIASVVALCRAADGGYTNTPGSSGSLYHTFLAALCHELLGRSLPEAASLRGFVPRRQQADGGFCDVPASPCSGLNATAAAVGLLTMNGAPDAVTAERVIGFLLSTQEESGGFRAHQPAPAADLMSTFTALSSLSALGAIRRARLGAVGRFVTALADPVGGFRACPVDESCDVEYTYYGLGALALLAGTAANCC